MRVLAIHTAREIARVMKEIKVDLYGIGIMLPKAVACPVLLESVSNITANILKQELLSLGGDAAVARGSLTGAVRRTDCLLIANVSQLQHLSEKLKKQPFGLAGIAGDLKRLLADYRRDVYALKCGTRCLKLGGRTRIMGIINLTPDSFSGDGLIGPAGLRVGGAPGRRVCGSADSQRRERYDIGVVMEHIARMADDGADVIDIGGESTRPGARPVSADEERRRVLPVIRAARRRLKIPLSIDTRRPEVARAAVDNGADIVNDVGGLRDARMRSVVASSNAAVVIMHMRGTPRTMQTNPRYDSLIGDIIAYLRGAFLKAHDAGITPERILIDPGIGFGKTFEHNLFLLKRLAEFKALGRPILIGPSRKSFIGRISGTAPQERLPGTIAGCVMAAHNGAHIVRVHDVKAIRQALDVADRIRQA